MAPIACKSVVVTGGSRGIGLGLVTALLAQVNRVVATSTRPPEAAERLTALAAQHEGRLTVARLDVTQPASVAEFAAGLRQHTQHVDVRARGWGYACVCGGGGTGEGAAAACS
jgi:NAD(P)-dependent dehydrogenase (short-subunit alcohol dehydrogenase family)